MSVTNKLNLLFSSSWSTTHSQGLQNKRTTVHHSDSTVMNTLVLRLQPIKAFCTNQHQITYITVRADAIWRVIGGEKFSPNSFPPTDFHIVRLTVNKHIFCVVAIAYTASILLSTGSIENLYFHCCTCNT